jgi:rubrerythrin
MASNRITFFLAAAAILAIAGCGGGGGASSTESEKEADAAIVNAALARELTAIGAYTATLPHLRGADLALARELRAQEQEHVDGLTKALRGLGAPVEAEPEEADLGEAKSRGEFLAYLYERESSLVANHLREVADLSLPWPRALLGSIVADEAQHLTLLRQALGAGPAESVPKAFESGTAPAP